MKQAIMGQARFGEFPAHAKKLQSDLVTTLKLPKARFPNLQIAYLSSRIYTGYATKPLNPEPYAYEGAFSIRWIIDAQVRSDAELNADSTKGEVKAPVVLWGPYLWADGTTPRTDGLVNPNRKPQGATLTQCCPLRFRSQPPWRDLVGLIGCG